MKSASYAARAHRERCSIPVCDVHLSHPEVVEVVEDVEVIEETSMPHLDDLDHLADLDHTGYFTSAFSTFIIFTSHGSGVGSSSPTS